MWRHGVELAPGHVLGRFWAAEDAGRGQPNQNTLPQFKTDPGRVPVTKALGRTKRHILTRENHVWHDI
jgi:hypothetical protein